jgi:serine/threonine-protein kinase
LGVRSTVAPATDVDGEPSVVGRLLEGRYRVEGLIARGGMGEVFRGRDVKLDRPVAIKFLSERFRSDASIVQRFLREAQSAAKLDHPNIVAVYSVGEEEGRPFFVMKHVTGQNVAALTHSAGRLPWDSVAGIAIQICDGLAHIHENGFVHRDIKPQNVMVDSAGRAIILDFGILRVLESSYTQTGIVAGTPEYMSPEQAKDPKTADARTDLYSLGVTLFEMLTGRAPFLAPSAFELMVMHNSEPAPRVSSLVPGLAPEVDALVDKCLAKDPRDRFQSAIELHSALRRLVSAAVVPIASAPIVARPVKTVPHGSAVAAKSDVQSRDRAVPDPLGRKDERPSNDLRATAVAGETVAAVSTFVRPRRRVMVFTTAAVAASTAAVAIWLVLREPPRAPASVVSAPASPVAVAAPAPAFVAAARAVPPSRELPAPAAPPVSPSVTAKPSTGAKVLESPRETPSDEAPRSKPRDSRADDDERRLRKHLAKAAQTKRPRAQLAAVASPDPAPVSAAAATPNADPEALRTEEAAPNSGSTTAKTKSEPERERSPSDVVAVARKPEPPATLHVVSQSDGKRNWASLAIDGDVVGDTHAAKRQVAPGVHVITARRDGYRDVRREVTVASGEVRRVILTLEKK